MATKRKQKAGERLKYLILNAPKENPNIVFNDDYKKEIKDLIEEIQEEYKKQKEIKDDIIQREREQETIE